MARKSTKTAKRSARLDQPENENYRAKSKPISFRISRELLDRVEAARAERGQERSELLEEVIKIGLNELEETARPDAMRSLLALVELAAERCSISLPNGRRFTWNEDLFLFEALMHVLPMLLKRFEPKDESVLLPEMHKEKDSIDEGWRQILASPESLGDHVRGWIIGDLDHYEVTPVRELVGAFKDDNEGRVAGRFSQHTIKIAQIRRYLNYRREQP